MVLWPNPRATVCRRRWTLLALAAVLFLISVVVTLQRFLSLNAPLGHGVLVVEGWIPDSSFDDALASFRKGAYSHLVVIGGPSHRLNTIQFERMRLDGASRTTQVGSAHGLIFLPVSADRNRTYATALTFRTWAEQSGLPSRSVDVFTEGVHGRKSWILFRKALGDQYAVGIISGTERSYDSRYWFISRRGLMVVSRNIIGYAYFKAAIIADNMGWKILSD